MRKADRAGWRVRHMAIAGGDQRSWIGGFLVSHFRAITAATVLAGALSGCGTTAPSSVSSWNRLTAMATCEAMNPRFCAGVYGFSIQNGGRFTAGPAPDGTTVTGSITATENAELSQDLAAVIPGLGARAQCDSAATVPGVSETLDLQLSNGSSAEIVAPQGPGSVCYRGGRDAAKRLDSDFRAVMTQHYPLPFPQ